MQAVVIHRYGSIHGTFPFVDFRAAFAELEAGHARGKIVVTMA